MVRPGSAPASDGAPSIATVNEDAATTTGITLRKPALKGIVLTMVSHLRLGRYVALCAMVAAAASCGSSSCSSVGYVSGVGIQVPTGWTIAEFCVDDDCLPAELTSGTEGFIEVGEDEPRDYVFSLRATSPSGDQIKHRGAIDTKASKRCGSPTVEAFVTVDESGQVAVVSS